MDQDRLSRRSVLLAGAASLTVPFPASAQLSELLDLLGLRSGKGATQKPIDLVRTIAAILELETSANARGLPDSRLAFHGKGFQLEPAETSFYQDAMPRLVTLLDRAERGDPAMADQAGALLADLNASQRVPPEAAAEPPGLSARRDFEGLKGEYARLFETCAIRTDAGDTLNWHANAIRNFRSRYESVGKPLGIPWYFIGAIHGLEASFNFRAHLHNGDFPLAQRTRQVPAGRPSIWGPPSDWEASATDALKLLGFAGQSDWSLPRMLYRLEAYNGFGYRRKGVATPYLWSFSGHYERGKFVADGRWNPNARSQQCGAAVAIKLLSQSGDVSFG